MDAIAIDSRVPIANCINFMQALIKLIENYQLIMLISSVVATCTAGMMNPYCDSGLGTCEQC